jgi:pyridoxine/pyridoxamine 5'-phosphate oxidase
MKTANQQSGNPADNYYISRGKNNHFGGWVSLQAVIAQLDVSFEHLRGRLDSSTL